MRGGMQKLIDELKHKMIETLNLTDVTADQIDEHAPLVGGELGIDSIDVLEMVMMIEKDYQVVIDSKDLGEKVFASLSALARYLVEKAPETATRD